MELAYINAIHKELIMVADFNSKISLRFCVLAVALSFAVLSSGAHAYILDTKIGEANLGNSGDDTEKNTLASILGVDASTLVQDIKDESPTAISNGAGEWYLDVDPDEPGYFLLKFGTGGTGATADTFYFQNIVELTKLVWSDSQVQFLSGGDCGANGNGDPCNIGRLSHYTTYNGGGGGGGDDEIPEPGVLFLMGAGLMGLGLARRRKSA